MKVLVVSNTPWSSENPLGNTLSNIFSGLKDVEFANIYCRPGKPSNNLRIRYFQITEKSLINNLIDESVPSGREVYLNDDAVFDLDYIFGYKAFRKKRLQLAYWIRDFIWRIGRWKSSDLETFLNDFNPDVLFQPIYYQSYLNAIGCYCSEYAHIPIIGYISDDNYTLKQFRISPLYWIDRMYKRKKIRELIDKCDILYVISDIQCLEYEKIFRKNCKILTKGADFSNNTPRYSISRKEIVLNYAGGIAKTRYRSLALISEAVKKLNETGYAFRFDIYTATDLTRDMKKRLNVSGTFLHGAVSYYEIKKVQKEADILIHAEGLDIGSRLEVHQSFSTKLVDYFELGKCIFAIGTKDMASIKHLMDNGAAIVSTNKDEVFKNLKMIADDPSIAERYGKSAYECGRQHHEIKDIQKMLIDDINMIVGKKNYYDKTYSHTNSKK